MSDEGASSLLEAMERERARLLEEVEAKKAAADALARDMAELAEIERLAAKFNLVVSTKEDSRPVPEGSVASWIRRYRTDSRSPYPSLKYTTRANYDLLLKRIEGDCGNKSLTDLNMEVIQRLYDAWKERGDHMAHGIATMLRGLVNFGVALGDRECERLSVVLHNMRFKVAAPRKKKLTAEQANAIRVRTREMDRPSIALVQAIHFECRLPLRDIIGEWVPINEPGTSEIIDGKEKWLRGLRWSEVDENLKLRHNSGQKIIEIDLKRAPMVVDELQTQFCDRGEPLTRAKLPARGPMVVYEKSDLPYSGFQFRRFWRMAADAAGVPKSIKIIDSRPRVSAGQRVQGLEPDNVRASEEMISEARR